MSHARLRCDFCDATAKRPRLPQDGPAQMWGCNCGPAYASVPGWVVGRAVGCPEHAAEAQAFDESVLAHDRKQSEQYRRIRAKHDKAARSEFEAWVKAHPEPKKPKRPT